MGLLERRVGVLDQRDEIVLIPGASLWRWLEGIVITAEAIISSGRAVGGSVRFSPGFDPNDSIN